MTTIREFPNLEALSRLAAVFVLEQAQQAVKERGRFCLVLSGGSTPKRLYELLISPLFVQQIPWQHTHLFFGDERMVAWEHEQSNYGMVNRVLLQSLLHQGVWNREQMQRQVHGIRTDLGSTAESASQYEKEILDFFGPPSTGRPPRFDLVLLGMGEDGHTASLFPSEDTLKEQRLWVVPVQRPGSSSNADTVEERVTLTAPILSRGRNILFLISGEKKQAILNAITGGEGGAGHGQRPCTEYPAGQIDPKGNDGELLWFVAAGS